MMSSQKTFTILNKIKSKFSNQIKNEVGPLTQSKNVLIRIKNLKLFRMNPKRQF